jgi:hypothetical protein
MWTSRPVRDIRRHPRVQKENKRPTRISQKTLKIRDVGSFVKFMAKKAFKSATNFTNCFLPRLIPQAGPDAARTLDPGVIERDGFDFADDLIERDRLRLFSARCEHHTVHTFVN